MSIPSSTATIAPWLLVFDLDGTLIDSSLDLCLSVNAALRHSGLPGLDHGRITGFIGDGAQALIRRSLLAAQPKPVTPTESDAQFAATFAFFLAYYRDHKLANTRTYEGVLPALHALRHAKPSLLMAVLTNKPVRPAQEICAALGIAEFCFAICGGDSFLTKKPDPEGLQAIISQAKKRAPDHASAEPLGANQGVIMIGDSSVDVQTARNAGVRSLGCRYGLDPESLLTTEPDLWCDSPSEWPGLLQ